MTLQLIRWKPQTKTQVSASALRGIWWRVEDRKNGLILIRSQDRRDIRWIQAEQMLEIVTPDSEWIKVYEDGAKSVPA